MQNKIISREMVIGYAMGGVKDKNKQLYLEKSFYVEYFENDLKLWKEKGCYCIEFQLIK